MTESILKGFEFWTDAQGIKSKGRVKGIDNISLEGIARLRELILDLAIRGKLVSQNENDEPASELLNKIEDEKKRLITEKGIGKTGNFNILSEDIKPFELPQNWEWTFIRNIGHDWGQKIPDMDFTYIDVSAIDNSIGEITNPTILNAGDAPSRARKIVKKGTVLYSTVRPYLKNICVVNEDFDPAPIASTAFAIIYPYLQMPGKYFYYYFRSPFFIRYVESVQTGIAYPAINDKQFFDALIPLPPIKEQLRIIQKVDELMFLCNQLEEQQTANLTTHLNLVKSYLETLSNAADADELQAAWKKLAEHFDTLFCTEDSIEQLKQTILQLAIMGRLVKQDPNDEPASELKNKIKNDFEEMAKEGKAKKPSVISDITNEEEPFKLPNGWSWVRLQEIIQISSGDGLTASQMNSEGSIPVFGGNGINGYHNKANISKATIVIGRVGFYCGSIHVTPDTAWVTDNAFITTFSEVNMNLKFIYWLLKGTNLKENDNATAQPVISGRKVYPIVVALPPLNEQGRIVSKIEELFSLCETLYSKIEKAAEIKSLLSQTVVANVI